MGWLGRVLARFRGTGPAPQDLPSAPRSASLRAALAEARAGQETPVSPECPAASPRGSTLRLAVDDVGDWIVRVGGGFSLGQAGARHCDLPVHGPLQPLHAFLEPLEGFHGGEAWSIVPASGAHVLLDGSPVDSQQVLRDGQSLDLAGARFTVRAPDPASASLVLVPEGDHLLGGAGGLLAWFPGPGGQVRIGGDAQALLPLPGAQAEVLLEATSDRLDLATLDGEQVSSQQVGLPLTGDLVVELPLVKGARPTALCLLQPSGQFAVGLR